MRASNLKIVKDFSDAEWFKNRILESTENKYCMGHYIPTGFESYISIRHDLYYEDENSEYLIDDLKVIEILKEFTTSPNDCFMALWTGFGWNFEKAYKHLFPRNKWRFFQLGTRAFENYFLLPNRDYFLMRGPIDESLEIGYELFGNFNPEPVNLLWPEDQQWFLAKEIDFDVTLIGGTEQLISTIENSGDFITERFDVENYDTNMFLAEWIENIKKNKN
jgi:hypothetical protein